MSKINFEKIINQGKLEDFILGRGDFLRGRPEEDYDAWLSLENYYIDSNDNIKKRIEEIILGLFDAPDQISKRASLDLCTSMKIRKIKGKILEFLDKNQLETLEPPIQQSLIVTITVFHIEELENDLIVFIIKTNRTKNFLMWGVESSRDTTIRESNLWRIELIASYYDRAGGSIKDTIKIQLIDGMRHSDIVKVYLNTFLDTNKELNDDFMKLVKSIL